MKLVKLELDGKSGQGVLEHNQVRLVGDLLDSPADESSFDLPRRSQREIESLLLASTVTMPLSSVRLAVPIDTLRKIICVGVNYREHAGEISADAAQNPILFVRCLDSLVPHGHPVILPRASATLDYEGEIAVVIGREGRHIPVENAKGYIFGYSCFLDGRVREYQRHSLMTGKNFWRSGAMGPWIVTADEVGGSDLLLQTRLNGVVVQSALQSQMIFSIPEVISYCSRWTLLKPGDVIAMGTPGGVGSRRDPPLWLREGDTVEVEVDGVGRLANRVAAET
jgi:2-keto-4-pentenoate hydratase/2-oxohepta-3-ene-1,7-dioic acid hydratase in catechol pathway